MNTTLQDPRAYMQRRISTFAIVTCIIFTAALSFDLALTVEGEPLLAFTRIASFSVAAVSGGIWLFMRTGDRSVWQCRVADLAIMAATMIAFATQPLLPASSGVPSALALWNPIPLATVTMLRAAVIPSPAWLSALVTLIWGVVMTWCSVEGWEDGMLLLDGHEHENLPLQFNGAATAGLTLVAGVISHVVFGLQNRVREAMQLGQYTLESRVGEGGMGVVYRARHAMLRRPTAIKLLPPDKSSEEAITRFEREVQQTCRLTHPNTVAIFDFGRTHDGVFYYAMEYLDGVSLEDLVKMDGPQPPERVIHVLLQVAEALGEAHGLGLIHRDIKPDNVMLCERGGVSDAIKVLDFGLVKDLEAPETHLSAAGAVQGTPLYIAPETITSADTVDGRTDLYSLGAVAYYLLTGETVFSGTIVEVFAHHIHTEPTPPSARGASVDPDLEAIVIRCLRKAPEERFASTAELGEALRRCEAADRWTRTKATAWWDANRDAVSAGRMQVQQPVSGNLTIGLALTESSSELDKIADALGLAPTRDAITDPLNTVEVERSVRRRHDR